MISREVTFHNNPAFFSVYTLDLRNKTANSRGLTGNPQNNGGILRIIAGITRNYLRKNALLTPELPRNPPEKRVINAGITKKPAGKMRLIRVILGVINRKRTVTVIVT